MWRSNQLSYRTVVAGTPGHHQIFFEKDSRESVQDTGEIRFPSLQKNVTSNVLKRTYVPALQKGGVPAAPSGTATLLRLSPNYQFRPRPTLAVTDFRRPRLSWLDGGVYKARERIHRAMADARLLANPASWGRVADPNPN